jgi:hypothetical protein
VACDDNGVASFDLVRHHKANQRIFLYAFDLIELNGDDLRRDPLEGRKGRGFLAVPGPIVGAGLPGLLLVVRPGNFCPSCRTSGGPPPASLALLPTRRA